MVKTGPKSIYGDGDMGQKFVEPNPGLIIDEVVSEDDDDTIFSSFSFVLALSQLIVGQNWT